MPNDPGGDALHLAVASYCRMDVLLTWNYRYLANPNKMRHIRAVNRELGLAVPLVTTPLDDLQRRPIFLPVAPPAAVAKQLAVPA